MEQLVYFIQAGDRGPVKIGVAVDPEHRLRDLQTGHHESLRLLTTWRGGVSMERRIHSALAEEHLRGEWFAPSARLEQLVRNVRRLNVEAEERGWCEQCQVRPIESGRQRFCSDLCAAKVARLRSREWKRDRRVAA